MAIYTIPGQVYRVAKSQPHSATLMIGASASSCTSEAEAAEAAGNLVSIMQTLGIVG
jgi:hypothetical protein